MDPHTLFFKADETKESSKHLINMALYSFILHNTFLYLFQIP